MENGGLRVPVPCLAALRAGSWVWEPHLQELVALGKRKHLQEYPETLDKLPSLFSGCAFSDSSSLSSRFKIFS